MQNQLIMKARAKNFSKDKPKQEIEEEEKIDYRNGGAGGMR